MPQTITIQEVGNALGQYCADYSDQIHSTLKVGLEIENMFPMVPADRAYQGQDAEIGEVLQPYQKAFTPNNTETYSGILSLLRIGKVDLSFDWEKMQVFFDKWKMNWFEAGKDENEWSYPRFVLENLVLRQLAHDLNESSYKGTYQAPATPGTPGPMINTFSGLKEKIEAFLTAGTINVINTGALQDNTMVDQVKAFVKSMPAPYRTAKGTLLMSKTNALRYADDFQAKYPNRKVEVETGHIANYRVDHVNKVIVGLDSMEGSDRIIAQFDNLPGIIVINRRGYPKLPKFRAHTDVREVKVVTELYRDFSFETLKHTFVNELS